MTRRKTERPSTDNKMSGAPVTDREESITPGKSLWTGGI